MGTFVDAPAMRRRALLLGVLAAVSLLWCGQAVAKDDGKAVEARTTTASAAAQFVRTEIYLGRNLPGGREISRKEFGDYLNTVLTKEFPQGLTVVDAYGQMMEPGGKILKQATWLVIVVHENTSARTKAVDDAVAAYRARFKKAQVMRLSSPTSATFFPD